MQRQLQPGAEQTQTPPLSSYENRLCDSRARWPPMKVSGQAQPAQGSDASIAAAAATLLLRKSASTLTDWSLCAPGCLEIPRVDLGACIRRMTRARSARGIAMAGQRIRRSVDDEVVGIASMASSSIIAIPSPPKDEHISSSKTKLYCSACRKSFGSAITLQNHLKSKKHKQQEVQINCQCILFR